jgi:hypothetical protein
MRMRKKVIVESQRTTHFKKGVLKCTKKTDAPGVGDRGNDSSHSLVCFIACLALLAILYLFTGHGILW